MKVTLEFESRTWAEVQAELMTFALAAPIVQVENMPEEEEAPAEVTAAAEPEQFTPVVTMEECRAALNGLRERKGAAAVRELLQAHGASKFADVSADQYAALKAEAEA